MYNIKQRCAKYENFLGIYFRVANYIGNHNINMFNSQLGGSIQNITKIINKYTNKIANIEVDTSVSTDEEVVVGFISSNKQITCASFCIRIKDRILEILDLRSDIKCIKVIDLKQEKVMSVVISIIIDIAKKNKNEKNNSK